jgi:hypothetical protein
MSVILSKDPVFPITPQTPWLLPSEGGIEKRPIQRVRRQGGLLWTLIGVAALVALFACVTKVVERETMRYKVPAISVAE